MRPGPSAFLIGDKIKRTVPTAKLKEWASSAAGIPDWLFDECNEAVGDVAETIALLLATADGVSSPLGLRAMVEERLLPLQDDDETALRNPFSAPGGRWTTGSGLSGTR